MIRLSLPHLPPLESLAKRFSYTAVSKILLVMSLLWSCRISPAQIVEYGNGEMSAASAPHLVVGLAPVAGPVAPGKSGDLALTFQLEPGWHVYWEQPGDSGQPPSVTWVPRNGIDIGRLEFPAPHRLPSGTLMAYGYEGSVTLPVPVHVGPSVPPGQVLLQAHVTWLVCREVCIPGKAMLGTKLEVKRNALPTSPKQLIAAAKEAEPMPLPSTVNVQATASRESIALTFLTGRRELAGEFFPSTQGLIQNSAVQTMEARDEGGMLTLRRSETSDIIPPQLKGVLELSDGRNYQIDLNITAVEPHGAQGETPRHLAAPLMPAFLGGLLLNLMPCVFPVLFIKALVLVDCAQDQRSAHRLHGLAYTAGILVSFWIIVTVLLVMRRVGHQVGWGFQLQSPVFVALMASLLFLMALSLAGQFDLGLSLTSKGDALTRRNGLVGSFFTGVLATVVATPCTGPLMGAAVGFALYQTPGVTFGIFTTLAVGLALPYLLFTLQPAWVRMMPRPGRWMETVKQATALPLLCTVAWLVWVYGTLYGESTAQALDRVGRLLLGLIILAVAGWSLNRWVNHRARWISASILLMASVWVSLSSPRRDRISWQPYREAAVAQARNDHRPVFVDFTAAWCLSCQVNERTVLQDSDIERHFDEDHYVLLRADWTRYDPEITEQLARVQRSGVPTYIVYPSQPNGKPLLMPEFLTKATVLEALQRVHKQAR